MARATALVGSIGRALLAAATLTGAAGCLPGVQRPLSVWVVGDTHELAADSRPTTESAVFSASDRAIRLTAVINETAAFQIALRTPRPPAGPYNLQVSDLTGPAGVLAARQVVSVFRAHYVRREQFHSWYPQHTGRPATPTLFPDILVPWEAPRGGGPLILEGPQIGLIWVDIRVPVTTAPGEYVGELTLYGESSKAAVFKSTIRLRVVPVALPSERSLPVICRVDPRDLLTEHFRWPESSAEETYLLPDAPSHLAPVRLVRATMELFHEHRTTPVLWASFPKFRLVGDRDVEMDWEPYDALVGGWLDGHAFPDRVGLAAWPIPASLSYPDAQRNGSFHSPRYARLLAAYLAECKRHFAERGWLERSFVRLCPPAPLTAESIADVRRAGGIIQQSETALSLVAHLPPRSLRGLGWHNAPPIELATVSTWAPPATWYEPEAMEHERSLGRQTWFQPSDPPYSGSLAVEAPANDARVLPWQAYRYDAQAIWIEHAADGFDAAALALVYAGMPYGLADRPVPSIRLKRLRAGLEDVELLRLLERRGRKLAARQIAEQVVRWAGTDACVENLLSTRPTGWSDDARVPALARELLVRELATALDSGQTDWAEQLANRATWGGLMNQPGRIHPEIRGVRLTNDTGQLRAHAFMALTNRTDRALRGRWQLPAPPLGWRLPDKQPIAVLPDAQTLTTLEIDLAGLAYNTDGVYPFELRFDTEAKGAFAVPGRLAVAACPYVEKPPHLDGDLADWIMPLNNAAGDFLLCRGHRPAAPPERIRAPTLPTRAFVCMDEAQLYVGVRCALEEGEPPVWQADNTVPVDGAIPWGQDVVEILLSPRSTLQGTSSDLLVLQVKPNGVLVASRGCRTDPPIGTVEPWQSGARVTVRVQPDAWIVELALPLSALGDEAARSRIWGFNVTRLDARRGEYSSWSGARGHCYAPQALGNLLLLRP